MKIKGKMTEVKTVEIDVEQNSLTDAIKQLNSATILKCLREKIIKEFTDGLVSKEFGLPMYAEYAIIDDRLYKLDAEWDNHNNVGIPTMVRLLTHDEIKQYGNINDLLESLDVYANV